MGGSTLGTLLLSLLLLLAAQLAVAQKPVPLQHLFKFTCDGTTEVAPSSPFGMALRFPFMRNIFEVVMDMLKGRAQCACPQGFSDDEFDQLFNPFVAMLNNVQGTPAAPHQCLAKVFSRNLAELTMIRLDLPNTCSLARWKAEKKCTVKHPFPRVDAELQLALSQCPGSHFPAISLTCGGSGCANLGKVCKADADCGGKLTCFSFSDHYGFNTTHMAEKIFEFLQSALVYDEDKDASPGCYQSARGTGAPTPTNDLVTNLLSFASEQFWGSAGVFSELSFCGILETYDFKSEFSLEQTALAGAEADLEIVQGPPSCLFEDSGGDEVERYFEKISTNGTFSWRDAVLLMESTCPQDNSMQNHCFSSWTYSRCWWYQLRNAFMESPFACFPNCPPEAWSSVVTENDVRWYFGAQMERLTANNPAQTLHYGLDGAWRVLNEFPSGLYRNNWELLIDSLDRILDVIPLESDGTFSVGNRAIYRNVSLSTGDILYQLRDALRYDVNCKLSWSKSDFFQMLRSKYSDYLAQFNEDQDDEFSEAEMLAALDRYYGDMRDLFRSLFPSPARSMRLEELDQSFVKDLEIVWAVMDVDSDDLISLADINYASRSMDSAGRLFAAVLDEFYWPLDENRASFGPRIRSELIAEYNSMAAAANIFGGQMIYTWSHPLFNQLSSHSNVPLSLFDEYILPELLEKFRLLDVDQSGDVSYDEARSVENFSLLNEAISALLSYQHYSPITLDDYLAEFSPFDRLNATTRVHLKTPQLAPWDGIIAAPLSVFPITNVIQPPQPDPSKVSLAKFTCDQKLVLDTHNVGLLPNALVSKVANHALGLLKDLVACRSSPPSTDSATFLTRYGAWAPLLWLHLIDDQAVSFPLPTESDWLSGLFGFDQDDNIRISNLPASCNFERAVTEGVCSFEFLGLSKLLLADITLRFTAKSCGSGSLAFSYEVECVGADCPWLEGLTPCDTSAHCTPGMTCVSMPEFVAHVSPQILDAFDVSTGEEAYKILTNRTAVERIALRTDFLELFLSKKYNNGTCSTPILFADWEEFVNLLGNSVDSQCFGPTKWAADLQRMMVRLLGPRQIKHQTQSKLRFCMPDKEVFEIDEMETWATSLVEVDGNQLTLNADYFKSYIPSPTSAPTATPTTKPGDNSGLPTCRCSSKCGNLGPACSACYQAGGMVLPSTPGACFCPSDRSTLSLSLLNNYLPSFGLLCKDPLPTCSDCTACHASCATCFGPASDQCLSCSNPDHVFTMTSAATGALEKGRCMPPCPAGQYRNRDGKCQGPDCSTLNNCTSAGRCFHSTFALVDRCLCNEGHFGADCSQAPDCSAYGNCHAHGVCFYSQHFRSGRCRCLPGYRGADCAQIVVKATPSHATELGGSLISVSRGAGFASSDQVVCVFGQQQVDAIVLADKTAACAAPPSSEARLTVRFGVKVNGGALDLADDPFVYTPSGELPPVNSQLFWPSGETRTIALGAGLSSEVCQGAVTVSLLPWAWDQFADGQASPILQDPVAVTSTASAGSVQVTMSLGVFPFTWDKVLYILSISKGACRQNSYVVPVPFVPNYPGMCQAWISQEALVNRPELQTNYACPPSLFAADPNFETFPTCSLELGVSDPSGNCYVNQGAAACRITSSPFPTFPVNNLGAGQLCCYNQLGDLLSNRVQGGGHPIRFGVGPSREIRVVRQFVGDLLPSLLCCPLGDNCAGFDAERSGPLVIWVPPTLGGGFGDPHFVTLDGKFWTFNGLGEYVLVERSDSHPFVLQGRFTQASAPNGTLTSATLMTAAAVKDGSNVISVYLDELIDDLVFFDGETQVGTLPMGTSYQSSDGGVMIFASGGKYTVVLPSGVNLELKAEVSMINVFALLPDSFKGKTRGLLGTWNGNKNDDFTSRNGSVISVDSAQEDLFVFGQGYRTTLSDTLFVYPDGEGHASYNDGDFIPDFTSPAFATTALRDQAQAACAGAPDPDACMYDVAQTGDLRTANVALKSGAVFQTFASAANTPPGVMAPAQISVKLEQRIEVSYTVTDAEGQAVTLGLLTAPTSTGTLDSAAKKYSFIVSTTMFLERSLPSLAVVGVDEGGSSSAPAVTNFTLVYSTCDDGIDALVKEASLELTASCLGDECSEACAEALTRLLALPCRSDVIKQIGQLYTAGRDKCCTGHEAIPCTDGLSQGAVIGIAVGAGLGGLALIAAIAAAVYFSRRGKSDKDKLYSTEMAKM